MNRIVVTLATACVLLVAAGCASTGEGQERRDFELYVEGHELENVTVDPEFGADVDMSAERGRLGARFAFGPETVRGFFQVFREEWEFTDLPGGRKGAEYDNWGIGGGAKGAPEVGRLGEDVAMIIPYRGELSWVWGENSDDSSWEMAYVDVHLEGGFGIDWKGLRPSVGMAISAIGGVTTGNVVDNAFAAGNVGLFLDVMYKLPDIPIYGHLRLLGGDYRMLTLGIGAKF